MPRFRKSASAAAPSRAAGSGSDANAGGHDLLQVRERAQARTTAATIAGRCAGANDGGDDRRQVREPGRDATGDPAERHPALRPAVVVERAGEAVSAYPGAR